MYRLLIYKKDGEIKERRYSDYDEMDNEAIFFQFSNTFDKVVAQKRKLFGWKEIFTIK